MNSLQFVEKLRGSDLFLSSVASIWSRVESSLHSHICPRSPSGRTRIKFVCGELEAADEQQPLCVKPPTAQIKLIEEIDRHKPADPTSDDHAWPSGAAHNDGVLSSFFNRQALPPLISLHYVTAEMCISVLLTRLTASVLQCSEETSR